MNPSQTPCEKLPTEPELYKIRKVPVICWKCWHWVVGRFRGGGRGGASKQAKSLTGSHQTPMVATIKSDDDALLPPPLHQPIVRICHCTKARRHKGGRAGRPHIQVGFE